MGTNFSLLSVLKLILQFIFDAIRYILMMYYHDGIYLLIGTVIAVVLSIYIDPDKIRNFLMKKPGFSIWGSVAFGTFTPLCACGTMAVVISMVITSLPWGPIMAFLVSSPLMSPDVFVILVGITGLRFAIALTVASIILGIGAGYVTRILEKYTGFLKNQLRFGKAKEVIECCAPTTHGSATLLEEEEVSKVLTSKVIETNEETVCCSEAAKNYFFGCCSYTPVELERERRKTIWEKLQIKAFLLDFYKIGIKKILPFFTLFAFLAYLVKTFVPTEWIMSIYSSEHLYAVPLAAIIGLPLYVSSASALPLLRMLMNVGASHGAVLAFMITGPGTSVAVISGLAIIMRRKVIFLYLLFIFLGAILLGYLYDLVLYFY